MMTMKVLHVVIIDHDEELFEYDSEILMINHFYLIQLKKEILLMMMLMMKEIMNVDELISTPNFK